jgi:hypothetical protein
MGILAERAQAMEAIWAPYEASFHDEFVSFGVIWSGAKPAQRPHPPVVVGGYAPTCSIGSSASATLGPVERVLDHLEAAVAEWHGK